MSEDLKAIMWPVLLSCFACIAFGLMAMFQDIGKESKALEILTQCKAGEVVTINDTELHCGVVSKELNLEAAQYRAVKNCNRLIEGWENE